MCCHMWGRDSKTWKEISDILYTTSCTETIEEVHEQFCTGDMRRAFFQKGLNSRRMFPEVVLYSFRKWKSKGYLRSYRNAKILHRKLIEYWCLKTNRLKRPSFPICALNCQGCITFRRAVWLIKLFNVSAVFLLSSVVWHRLCFDFPFSLVTRILQGFTCHS